MKLTNYEVRRLSCWKEGEVFNAEPKPVLVRVVEDIVLKHWKRHKTAKGKLLAMKQLCDLILEVLT